MFGRLVLQLFTVDVCLQRQPIGIHWLDCLDGTMAGDWMLPKTSEISFAQSP